MIILEAVYMNTELTSAITLSPWAVQKADLVIIEIIIDMFHLSFKHFSESLPLRLRARTFARYMPDVSFYFFCKGISYNCKVTKELTSLIRHPPSFQKPNSAI